jgi:hypothetical protein
VSEDAPRLKALAGDLSRRYEADYQVVSMASASNALATLVDLEQTGAEVALLIADERLAEMPAVEFLARAHELHRRAKRVLLTPRGIGLLLIPPCGRWPRERSTITCGDHGLLAGVQAQNAGSASGVHPCFMGR